MNNIALTFVLCAIPHFGLWGIFLIGILISFIFEEIYYPNSERKLFTTLGWLRIYYRDLTGEIDIFQEEVKVSSKNINFKIKFEVEGYTFIHKKRKYYLKRENSPIELLSFFLDYFEKNSDVIAEGILRSVLNSYYPESFKKNISQIF